MDSVRDGLFVRAMGYGPEAESALELLRRNLDRNGIHPSDITLMSRSSGVFSQAEALIAKLDTRIADLRNLNRFLLTQVDPAVVRRAAKAEKIEYQGYDFDDLVDTRLRGLPHGWEKHVAAYLEVSVTTLRRWREGMEEIPHEVFGKLRDLPPMSSQPKSRQPMVHIDKEVTRGKENFPWGEYRNAEIDVSRMFIEGKSIGYMASYLSKASSRNVTDNMIRGKFYNRRPPAGLGVSVKDAGSTEPTDWAEMWEIGAQLGRGQSQWLAKIRESVGNYSLSVGDDLSENLTLDQVRVLREAYKASRLAEAEDKRLKSKTPKTLGDLEEFVRESGPTGVTKREITDSGRQHKRTDDLENSKIIFRVGSQNPVRFVHADFANSHPIDAEIANLPVKEGTP